MLTFKYFTTLPVYIVSNCRSTARICNDDTVVYTVYDILSLTGTVCRTRASILTYKYYRR